jgi:hypothetical protein
MHFIDILRTVPTYSNVQKMMALVYKTTTKIKLRVRVWGRYKNVERDGDQIKIGVRNPAPSSFLVVNLWLGMKIRRS